MTPTARSAATRSVGQLTVLMYRGAALVAADSALVTPYLPGTATPYPAPLYGAPDDTAPLVFPVATGADGVVTLWADAPVRLDVEAVHPALGRARTTLDVEPTPDAAPVPPGVALLAASQTFTGLNHFDDEIHSDGGLVLNSTTYLANPMNVIGDQRILPDANGRGSIGSVTNRFKELWSQLGDFVTAACGALSVAGKPVAVSPDSPNALEWRANGLYAPTGAAAGASYTKAEADGRFEPLDTMYTKAESDARYTQGGLTQAAADARYEPIDTMYTKAESDARYTQGGLTQAAADARYLQLAAGGTVAGATSFALRPTVAGVAQPRISVQSGAPSSPATGDLWVW